MADALTDYLAELERALKVHPRRRSRILAEIESHLQESAAQHGAAEAIARLGTPSEVATSFSPGLTDRLWAERDRLAALAMLAALLACVPLARDLWETNNGDRGVILYAVFLAPAALVATASAILVLLRRPAGRRLVAPLVVLVAVAALFTLLDLPPVAGVIDGYRTAVGSGYESSGCGTRALARVRRGPRGRDPPQLHRRRNRADGRVLLGRDRLDARAPPSKHACTRFRLIRPSRSRKVALRVCRGTDRGRGRPAAGAMMATDS